MSLDRVELVNKSAEEMFCFLRDLYAQSVQEFNKQLADSSSELALQLIEQETSSSTRRFAFGNKEKVLSLVGDMQQISAYIVPAAELRSAPQCELASRRKYGLVLATRQDASNWLSNSVPLSEDDVTAVVLSSVESLVRGQVPFKVNFRVAETSLTTAVQSLLQDRYRLSEALINQQERIFSSIARDIHDGVIGELMVLIRTVDLSYEGNDRILNSLEKIVDELRDVTADLSSREIRDWGLEAAICQLGMRYEAKSKGIRIRISFDSKLNDFPLAIALQIYRIVQEAMTNAVKHSKCKNVEVQIRKRDNELLVSVSDDGQGIDSSALLKRRGTGLHIMRERAELISANGLPASLTIRSNAGIGSVVELAAELPE